MKCLKQVLSLACVLLCFSASHLVLLVHARRHAGKSNIPPVPRGRQGQVYPSAVYNPAEEGVYRGYGRDAEDASMRGPPRNRGSNMYEQDNAMESSIVEEYTTSTSGKMAVALSSGKSTREDY